MASEMPYHVFSRASEQKSFRQAVAAVEVGKLLLCRLYDSLDGFEAEAAFRVKEIKDYKQGPMIGADFIGASKPADKIHIDVGDGDGEAMIHLCHDHPNCGRLQSAANTLHVTEWKTCDL